MDATSERRLKKLIADYLTDFAGDNTASIMVRDIFELVGAEGFSIVPTPPTLPATEIKNWPYFGGLSPYGAWMSFAQDDKFVPLSKPCAAHATGFDCYIFACGCTEYKFVKRSKKELAQIRALQESVRRESILRQADEIRASDGEQQITA